MECEQNCDNEATCYISGRNHNDWAGWYCSEHRSEMIKALGPNARVEDIEVKPEGSGIGCLYGDEHELDHQAERKGGPKVDRRIC